MSYVTFVELHVRHKGGGLIKLIKNFCWEAFIVLTLT